MTTDELKTALAKARLATVVDVDNVLAAALVDALERLEKLEQLKPGRP
jgi:hypothetical protein